MEFITVRRALVSVTDKTGLEDLVRRLSGKGVEILSTGGTAARLRERDIPVTDVAAVTGLKEMLDGRVKTLHPAIHGGILFDRDRPGHRADMERTRFPHIDLVVVNLYDFESTVSRAGVTDGEAIEKIDIGGPAMIRAAAKNHRHVVVLTDPAQYLVFLAAFEAHGGKIPRDTARTFAGEAFRRTAAYDAAIAGWFARGATEAAAVPEAPAAGEFPGNVTIRLEKIQDLRYGENPHQKAALYAPGGPRHGLAAARQRHGRELSFTNLLDLDAALRLLDEFEEPAAVVVKHVNPCGVGFAGAIEAAWHRALAADPLSAFGGVVGLNRPVDGAFAAVLGATFLEIIAAPSFTGEALAILMRKRSLRLIEYGTGAGQLSAPAAGFGEPDIRHLKGSYLVQRENPPGLPESLEVVTRREPTPLERETLLKAWRIVKRVKSNAIVLADATGSVGIGCGQTSRVDAVEDALRKAQRGVGLGPGTVLASDAFFPFRDSIDLAGKAGIRAVIQPGGSVRDEESVAAADEHNIAMVLTRQRVFLH